LDPISEPISTPKPLLYLNHIPEFVLVVVHFKPKSIIFHNQTQLSDKGVKQNDSEMIFQNWKLEGVTPHPQNTYSDTYPDFTSIFPYFLVFIFARIAVLHDLTSLEIRFD